MLHLLPTSDSLHTHSRIREWLSVRFEAIVIVYNLSNPFHVLLEATSNMPCIQFTRSQSICSYPSDSIYTCIISAHSVIFTCIFICNLCRFLFHLVSRSLFRANKCLRWFFLLTPSMIQVRCYRNEVCFEDPITWIYFIQSPSSHKKSCNNGLLGRSTTPLVPSSIWDDLQRRGPSTVEHFCC